MSVHAGTHTQVVLVGDLSGNKSRDIEQRSGPTSLVQSVNQSVNKPELNELLEDSANRLRSR